VPHPGQIPSYRVRLCSLLQAYSVAVAAPTEDPSSDHMRFNSLLSSPTQNFFL